MDFYHLQGLGNTKYWKLWTDTETWVLINIIYKDDPKELARIFKLAFQFSQEGVLKEFVDGEERFVNFETLETELSKNALEMLKRWLSTITSDQKGVESRADKSRENGKKGGRPTIEPPTLAEVREYWKRRGLFSMDGRITPSEFWANNFSKGGAYADKKRYPYVTAGVWKEKAESYSEKARIAWAKAGVNANHYEQRCYDAHWITGNNQLGETWDYIAPASRGEENDKQD